MELEELKQLIKEITIKMGMYSEESNLLLLMTAAHESKLKYRRQITKNFDYNKHAVSLFQIEKGTFISLFENYLRYRPEKLKLLEDINAFVEFGEYESAFMDLENDDEFAIAVCRLIYYAIPKSLPSSQYDLACYWKKYYNTEYGKGTVEKFLEDWEEIKGE